MSDVEFNRMGETRTRVAPSPTGIIHVGTGYISLFNWAYARKNKGKFILRLEDTDIKRYVKGAEDVIDEGLRWLGLVPDEKYKQSDRLNIYKEKAKELIDKGFAYEDQGAIRFKNPGSDITFTDLVRGEITFPGSEITDFVMVRSDGLPLYNFVVTVDDIEMKISHIIRGEEHISNTPRQLVLYKAFGVTPPKIAHIPLLRNPDRSKISKRKNPVSLLWYREEGYLPEALLNFFALLGWSHPEGKEIFNLEEFIKVFDFEHIHKTGPVFDMGKLDWINGEYIRRTQNLDLKTQIYEFLNKKYSEDLIEETIPLIKDRINKLSDYWPLAGFFFDKPKADKKLFGEKYKEHLESARRGLEEIGEWDIETLNTKLMDVVIKNNFKTGDFFMDLRVAITGSKFTPPINDSIVILGKNETLDRLRKSLEL
mgnify:CR=1 FL=1